MTRIRGYHRPSSIEGALALLARQGVTTTPLGGGTVVNGLPPEIPDEVVDLQDLGLDTITRDGPVLSFGAMARLQDVVDHEWTPPALRELAHRQAPNTIRNVATVGGTVAAGHWLNGFLAGLVAYGATVALAGEAGTGSIPIDQLLADRSRLAGGLITGVAIDLDGAAAFAATARTPADTPIVLVAGHRSEAGAVTFAATGVAATPIAVDLDRVDDLDPPADFRGSSEYRKHLTRVLGGRVRVQLEEGDAT